MEHSKAGNPQIRLIALDIDGTLLTGDRAVSDRTKGVIDRVKEMGIYVVLISGRSFSAVKPLYDQLQLHAPVVCYNGAGVFDGDTGETLFSREIDDWHTRRIVDAARSRDIHVQLFKGDEFYYERVRPEAVNYENHINLRGTVVNFDEMEDLRVLKALCLGEHEKLLELSDDIRRAYGSRIYQVFSFPTFLEIMHERVNKREGLKAVSRQFGIDPESIVAFGDGQNDIEMLQFAGIGVAMDNASDPVKEAADSIAPSNNDDGVSRFLEDLLGL